MEIAILAIVGLFLIYKTGLMELTQTSVATANKLADQALYETEAKSAERHTRTLGKVKSKLQDNTINRSSKKEINALLKAVGTSIDSQTETN